MSNLKKVISISLGSAKRNKEAIINLFGEEFDVRRVSANGDFKKFADMFREYDGVADAIGIGGADCYLWFNDKRYEFKEITNYAKIAKKTPVVDGSGLKNTLERDCIRRIQEEGIFDFSKANILVVSALDRFGLAQALGGLAKNIVYGDAMFALGLPMPIRKYESLGVIAKILLPIVTKMPFRWLYPLGKQQDKRTPKHEKWFQWADVIAGDWNYIRRYMPEQLPGKIILTQSIRKDDIELFKNAGIAKVITTTPEIEGESFATNVWEGIIVAHLNKKPEELTPADYLDTLNKMTWKLNVLDLK